MNDRTLYSVLLYGVKRKDFDNLGRQFVSGLTANLQRDGFSAEVVASIGMGCHPVAWGKTNNRSVLGSVNDLIFVCRFMAARRVLEMDQEIVELNHQLNQTPMKNLEEGFPDKEMAVVLEQWKP